MKAGTILFPRCKFTTVFVKKEILHLGEKPNEDPKNENDEFITPVSNYEKTPVYAEVQYV